MAAAGHGSDPDPSNPFLIDSTLVLNGIAAGYERSDVGYDQSLFWRVERPGAVYRLTKSKDFVIKGRWRPCRRAVPGLDDPARAAGSRPAQIVTTVRSPGTYPCWPAMRSPGGCRPRLAGDIARAARRIRVSRVWLGCSSVAVWVFVRFTRSFLLFEMYGDPTFTS